MKKFLSLLLTAVMILSLIPMSMFSVSAVDQVVIDEQGIEYTLSDDGTYYILTAYTGTVDKLIIPAEYNGIPVTEIANIPNDEETGNFFRGVFDSGTFSEVVIPNTITEINDFTFAYCRNLTEIIIPNSVKTIEQGTFWECTGLKRVEIPESLESLEMGAFSSCSSIEEIVVSPENKHYYSVNNCIIDRNYKMIVAGANTSVIPDDGSVVGIFSKAFDYRTFNSIVIPDSIYTIGSDAFRGCKNLTSVTIPISVEYMDWYAFAGCQKLRDVYCEAPSMPSGWDDNWLFGTDATVHWGYTGLAIEDLNETISETETNLIESDYAKVEWEKIQIALNNAKEFVTDGKSVSEIRAEVDTLENAILLNPKKAEFGDLNGDKNITSLDYLFVKRACFGTYELSNVELARSDINRDRQTNSADYLLVKRIAFGTYTVQ